MLLLRWRTFLTSSPLQDSAEFQQFAYHCQFARLNDVLTSHLRSLACDSKIIFNDSLSKLLVPSKQFSLLQSILYFLQVMGRQVRQHPMNILQSDLIDMSCKDFDSTGHCYRTYVAKMGQYLRLAVPWSQRFKNKIPRFLPLDVVCFSCCIDIFSFSEIFKLSHFKRSLRSSFRVAHRAFGSKIQLNLTARTPIPFGNKVRLLFSM